MWKDFLKYVSTLQYLRCVLLYYQYLSVFSKYSLYVDLNMVWVPVLINTEKTLKYSYSVNVFISLQIILNNLFIDLTHYILIQSVLKLTI